MKLLHATVATCLLSQTLACWPQQPSPQDEPLTSTPIAPVPQVSPPMRVVQPQPTARSSPSPDVPPPSKKRFEIFSIYPTPQISPTEPELQAPSQAPSPGTPETGPETAEEVVIIPAVPTPQVIDFSGHPSPKPKE